MYYILGSRRYSGGDKFHSHVLLPWFIVVESMPEARRTLEAALKYVSFT